MILVQVTAEMTKQIISSFQTSRRWVSQIQGKRLIVMWIMEEAAPVAVPPSLRGSVIYVAQGGASTLGVSSSVEGVHLMPRQHHVGGDHSIQLEIKSHPLDGT